MTDFDAASAATGAIAAVASAAAADDVPPFSLSFRKGARLLFPSQ